MSNTFNGVKYLFLSFHFWSICPEVAFSETLRMSEQPSSKDDVRRGLGMLPQRAIFEKASEGDFAKTSKPVQVCTACHFCTEFNTKLASRVRWFHFAHSADFPLEQSTQNCLPGKHPCNPSNNICDIGGTIFNRFRKRTSSQIETK